jgi:hypothetical protein
MKKLLLIIATLLVVAIGGLFAARQKEAATDGRAVEGQGRPDGTVERQAVLPLEAWRSPTNNRVALSGDLLRLEGEPLLQESWRSAAATRARDLHYERLLAGTPRDRAKEEQVLSTLREFVADKPDASVGEIACNADLCRAELLGVGQVNLLRRYGDAFVASLDPKGLTVILSDRADPQSPKVSCYFAREASWKPPESTAEL